jgi:LPPG:FO 2-phospho-L-lactate transferase
LDGETWQAMAMVGRYGGQDWFSLGDRDLGTHMYRTQMLADGATLSEITAAMAETWGLDLRIVPATDDRLRTMITTVDEGEIGFQEYFVRRQHNVAVTAVRFAGAEATTPAPGVLDSLESASTIVIAPSNPVVSIDPVLAVPGIRSILQRRRQAVVAVSPIVGGRALKGPADRLLIELGRQATVVAVAQWYADVVGTLIVDDVDADQIPKIEAMGVRALATDTIMARPGVADRLARTVLGT